MRDIQLFYSAETGAFYDPQIHGVFLPLDCVPVTRARHAQLLDDQANGAIITAGKDGGPSTQFPKDASLPELRERSCRAINAEARRRIVAIADLAAQSNDNADIAMLTGLANRSEHDCAMLSKALARRLAINAVRDSGQALKSKIRRTSKDGLHKLQIADDSHWPAQFERE